jgi:hypothetical protein
MVFATFGVSHHTLVAAAAACMIGLAYRETSGRWHALSILLAATLVSAVIGTALAEAYLPALPHGAQGAAAVLGLVLHPTLDASVKALPNLLQSLISAISKIWGRQ